MVREPAGKIDRGGVLLVTFLSLLTVAWSKFARVAAQRVEHRDVRNSRKVTRHQGEMKSIRLLNCSDSVIKRTLDACLRRHDDLIPDSNALSRE